MALPPRAALSGAAATVVRWPMPHVRLVQLIGSHKVRIARALGRQVRGFSANYASMDSAALESSFGRVLGHVEHYLTTGDDTGLRNHTAHTAQLRSALGFRANDFMLASLVFLPVMRRFLIEQATDLQSGLRDYEAFEAVAIPLLAEAALSFRRAAAANHATIQDEDDDEITAPMGRTEPVGARRFNIELVIGEPADEHSPFT